MFCEHWIFPHLISVLNFYEKSANTSDFIAFILYPKNINEFSRKQII